MSSDVDRSTYRPLTIRREVAYANDMTTTPASAKRSTALIKLNERERAALQRASEADGIGRTRWCREAVRRALEQRGFMFVRLCPAQPLVSTMAEMDAVDLSEEAQKRAMTASRERCDPDEPCDPLAIWIRVPDVVGVDSTGPFTSVVSMLDKSGSDEPLFYGFEVGMPAKNVRALLGIPEPAPKDQSEDAAKP